MTNTLLEASPDVAGSGGVRTAKPAGPPDAADVRRLPSADLFTIEPPPAAEHNPVYRELVGEKAEIVDLLAYAVYKQHKHDFREAFFAASGRDPTAAELAAYIIGESTPRRLAAYRFLAAAKLAGDDAPAPAGRAAGAPPPPSARGRKKGHWRQVAVLTTMLLGLLALAGVVAKMR